MLKRNLVTFKNTFLTNSKRELEEDIDCTCWHFYIIKENAKYT